MRIADNWQDYELIDTSSGEKLERWGKVRLIRPDHLEDPQGDRLAEGRRPLPPLQ